MLARAMVRLFGGQIPAAAGYRTTNQRRVYLETTAASMTLTPAHVASGYVVRSGQAGAIGDTTPSADALLAANPDLVRGDTIDLLIASSTANANTLVAGAGITLAGTTVVAASSVREFLITLTSEPKRTVVISASTTNASAVVSAAVADLANIGVGMGVSGTGIPASTTILAVNLTAGTFTMSAAATATNNPVGLTFTPQFEWRGVRTASL